MASAMPRPIPPLPPVTSATFPVRSNGLYMNILLICAGATVDGGRGTGNRASYTLQAPKAALLHSLKGLALRRTTRMELSASGAFGISCGGNRKGTDYEA